MTKEEYQQIKKALFDALDQAIANGDWEASLFFQNIGDKLRELRESIGEELAVAEADADEGVGAAQHGMSEAASSALTVSAAKKIIVYILLHQTDGDNLAQWVVAIRAIVAGAMMRPVYADEAAVQAVIRSKTDFKREAYLIAYVDKGAIRLSGTTQYDQLGQPLVALQERAINLANISAFVHRGHRYRFIKNQLVPA